MLIFSIGLGMFNHGFNLSIYRGRYMFCLAGLHFRKDESEYETPYETEYIVSYNSLSIHLELL